MTRNLLRAGALSCALMTSTAMCTQPALAQTPSVYQSVDGNGVDLVDGSFNFSLVEGVIGSGKAALALVRTFGAGGERDNLAVQFERIVSGGQATISIELGNRRETFSGPSNATSFTSGQAEGATLTKTSVDEYVYRDDTGTMTTFAPPPGLSDAGNFGYCATGRDTRCYLVATQTVAPDGGTLTYQWDAGENCVPNGLDSSGEPIFSCARFWRLRGMTNSYGYGVSFAFAIEANPTSGQAPAGWRRRIGATLFNNAVSGAPTRTVSYATPSSGVTEITTDGGHVWRLTRDSQLRLTGIRRPGSSSDDVSIGYAGATGLVVNAVTRDGVATSYGRSVSGTTGTMTVTDANGKATTVTSELTVGRPTIVTDPLNRTTYHFYDANGRHTSTVFPESNVALFSYDGRGNITQTQAIAKPGSGEATLTTSATYPSNCANPVTCNRPTSTTDARGNTTDYSYDSTHGGVTSVTGPAPTSGGTRPEVRYGYSLTDGEYQLTSVSACASGTASSCVGTSAETRMVMAYDANGNVISREARDGTGALSAVSAMTWTSAGDMATLDGPLPGTADTTHMRYNQARQAVGTISPDPDGGGSLVHRATRTTYDSASGLATRQEQGTVTDPSRAAWTNFSAAQAQETTYDVHQRPVVQRLTAGGTTYALTQTSYDSLGRADCTAQRMNPNEFASSSLPADACTLDTEGAFGPDRITRTSFDDAGQPILTQSGYGVSGVQADEVAAAYTANGRIAHVTDGEGNRTTYDYDGHDRLSRTRMPSPTTDGVSSTTDYEELGYDAAGNVTSRRLRDGNSIALTYDALNRPTLQDLPGSEPDVTYGYDLLGRLTTAATSAQTFTFAYDALGRKLTETGPMGTTTSAYDIAGRRTRLTWPGSPVTPSGQPLYVDYDYLVTGEMAAVRERGATSGAGVLATYSYDGLGRRTGVTRGNGTTTSYGYDAVSRGASLVHDLAGTAHDLTLGFTHNPAGQIAGNTRSNDTYSFNALANANVGDSHDGLNRLVATGGTSPSHDARGNLTGDGTATYGYDSQNRLTQSAAGGVTSAYLFDPLGRLSRIDASNSAFNSSMDMDGAMVIGEREPTGTRTTPWRAYVPGDAALPVALYTYYNGAFQALYWYHEDERGSPIALSKADGTARDINRYDDHGRPAATNWGRYQYTGQWWFSQPNIYHYRARAYHPGLGRFLQTDPIGYGDGMNLYGGMGGDPVNRVDPLGTLSCYPVNVGYSWVDPKTGERLGPAPGVYLVTQCDFGGGGASGPTRFFDGDGSGVGTGAPFLPTSEFYADVVGGFADDASTNSEQERDRPRGCISDSDGPVTLSGVGFDLSFVVGAGIGVYRFTISSTGAVGWVATGSFLGGVGGFFGGSVSRISTVGDMLGVGYRATGPVPRVPGGGAEILLNDRGSVVGGGGSLGGGGGLYGGRTRTRLLWSNPRRC